MDQNTIISVKMSCPERASLLEAIREDFTSFLTHVENYCRIHRNSKTYYKDHETEMTRSRDSVIITAEGTPSFRVQYLLEIENTFLKKDCFLHNRGYTARISVDNFTYASETDALLNGVFKRIDGIT